MENKINIAELLKDCPSGMELDCTMYDSVTLISVDNREDISFPIRVVRKDGNSITLTKYGQYADADFAKCVIFPKGKTTWEGFVPPCKFKDGDIVSTASGMWIGIVKRKVGNAYETYTTIYDGATVYNDDTFCFERLATEPEKQKLFNTIKENGYKWNAETKTLEKLVEPKFKVGDRIKHSRVESGNIYTVVATGGSSYTVNKNNEKHNFGIDFEVQDDWELVPDKFDITTLKQFDKVLVRGDVGQKWTHDFFGFMDKDKGCPFVCVGHYVIQCIPYKKNEHLLGKKDDWADFCKPRLATEEEKEKLFKAIKDNGYKWNAETKTLEKLVKPKFKVGDRIKYRGGEIVYRIIKIIKDSYMIDNLSSIPISIEHMYNLVPNKFDINTLVPFESRVLVRENKTDVWIPAFYGFFHQQDKCFYTTLSGTWSMCIPYNEDTKHLIGTTNYCDNFYKTWEK